MTQVEFHTGVADTVHFACRLLRKAYRQGETLLVTAPAPKLEALDRALWTFARMNSFRTVRMGADMPPPAVVASTPIWLSEGPAPTPCPPILVNLGAPMPTGIGCLQPGDRDCWPPTPMKFAPAARAGVITQPGA